MKVYRVIIISWVFVCGLLFAVQAAAETHKPEGQQWILTDEQWDLVKRGDQLLTTPVIQQAIEAWSLQRGQMIELRYPGGEEGELWVEELKDWLISLAIPSKYLFVVPGSGKADVIIIKIVKAGDI